MINFRKIAASAVAGLVISSACSCTASIGNGTQKAMSADGYDVNSGVFIYYSLQALDEALQNVSSNSGDDTSSKTTVKDLKNTNIDGIPADEWIQDKATEYCTSYIAIRKEFDKVGCTLTQDEISESDSMAESYYASDSRLDKNGISLDSVKDIALNSYREQAVFKHYFGIDSEKGCSEAELKDYFDDNFARVKYFSIKLTDDEGNEFGADEKRKLHQLAEDYARKINKKTGALEKMWEVDEASKEYDDYVAAQTTTAEGEDAVTTETTTTTAVPAETDASGKEVTTTTYAYENERLLQKRTTAAEDSSDPSVTTTAQSESDKTDEDFNNFVFNEMPKDEAVVYDYSDEEIYVIIRGDLRERMTEDDYWSDYYVDQLLSQRYYNDFTDMMKDIESGIDVDKVAASYRRYSPFKLDNETASN